jgi:hypothetical protein
MEEHYTVCQHSTPFILNGLTQTCFAMQNELSLRAADFFDTGIQKPIPRQTSALVSAVTVLTNSLSNYASLVYNNFPRRFFC